MQTRRILQGSLCALALIVATPALASSITLTQESDGAVYGDWILTQPNGSSVASHNREQARTISNVATGTFTLHVTPPAGAVTTVRLKENGIVKESVTASTLSFAVAADTAVAIQMIYTFQGAITVESIPTGSPFELQGPQGIRYTGMTPMTIRELPPFYYTVNFGIREGCTLPRPIKRELPEHGSIAYIGEYRCVASSPSSAAGRTSSASSTMQRHAARVVQSMNTSELIAGSIATLSTGVVNTGTATLHDLTFTVQFDPAVVSIASLPAGAVIDGNLVVWKIDHLYAGQRWSDQLGATLISGVKPGSRSVLTSRVSGTELMPQDDEPLYATATIGATALPATGGAWDIILATLGLAVPVPIAYAARKRRS